MLHLRVLLAALACLALIAAVRGDCGDYKEGQTWKTGHPDTCAQYTCKDGVVKGKTCPMYKVKDTCKLKDTPAGAVFPDCCPQFDCPED
ncbi:U-scoloptoxin(16)-Er12a-like isoform X1 [Thrips palmi]|uniref:U-scoloptoxin(16)-Er12a-like isoform X1 n=1 Tax=Thrips palmi TaxID=161013 RepID=A0A6P8ZLG8_THRPL|nr:U-scoloptoxin(16)-Er12a-like isoform X1 [Thrips palmi]